MGSIAEGIWYTKAIIVPTNDVVVGGGGPSEPHGSSPRHSLDWQP